VEVPCGYLGNPYLPWLGLAWLEVVFFIGLQKVGGEMSENGDGINAQVEALKEQGNQFFGEGQLERAVAAYTQGLNLQKDSHVLFSNRAAAFLKLGNVEKAVEDARKCVELAPEWAKGYTRLAQALLQLGHFTECEEALSKLEDLEPDNRNLPRLRDNLNRKKVFQKLKGKWHGKVSPELGGYVQKFDFLTENKAMVSVFERDIEARLTLNCSADPMHLDLLVDAEPDGQPQAPEVKHIFMIDDDSVLHLCSPFMSPPEIRPTKFEGPAYVKMFRGEPPVDQSKAKEKEKIRNLSEQEKCIAFAEAVTEALPAQRIQPLPSDSETVQAQLMQRNIQFQTAYFDVKQTFGDEIEEKLRLYLEREPEAPVGKLRDAVNKMRTKMQTAGLYPSDAEMEQMRAASREHQQANTATGTESASSPPSAPATTSATAAASSSMSAKQQDPTPKNEAAKSNKDKVDSSNLVLAVGLLAVGAAAIAAFALRRSSNNNKN